MPEFQTIKAFKAISGMRRFPDAVMSANAEPAPLMMEQGGDHTIKDPAISTIASMSGSNVLGNVSPPSWTNTPLPCPYGPHHILLFFFLYVSFSLSLCFVLETVKRSERGVCRTPISCTYITIFLFVCLFCWHCSVMPTRIYCLYSACIGQRLYLCYTSLLNILRSGLLHEWLSLPVKRSFTCTHTCTYLCYLLAGVSIPPSFTIQQWGG